MRPLAIALLLAATLAACGGSGAPDGSAVGTYAISADRLCAQLAGAIRHVFENSPDDPDEAMARYAREVGEAGRRFSPADPPASLSRFHRSAVAHVSEQAATLRRAARLSAAGDAQAAIDALLAHTGLLPERIPDAVLRRAPHCRAGVIPGAAPDGSEGVPA